MDPKFPEKVSLTFLPTPIEPLERLSRSLGGPEIWIKRDDQTGLATGGNKARKLEFLVADALAQGADHLVTTGAPQSNHARQTAAAAARYGLGCSLVLRGRRPETTTGNLLLDELFGAHVYWCDLPNCPNEIGRVMNTLRSIGLRPYFVPLGGSNAIGATGYACLFYTHPRPQDRTRARLPPSSFHKNKT